MLLFVITIQNRDQHEYTAFLPQAFHKMSLQDPKNFSWYMDTGASSHMTTDSGKIQTPIFSSFISFIFVGNGTSLLVKGSGNAIHNLPNKSYFLHHILYTPHIIKNLLSFQKFTRDNNVSLEFDPFGFSMKDLKTGRILLCHNSSGDLYPFTPPDNASSAYLTTSSSEQWHNQLGCNTPEIVREFENFKV